MTTRATTWILAMLLLAPIALAARPVGEPLVALEGSVPMFVAHAHDRGLAPPGSSLSLVVTLRLTDEAGLAAVADGSRGGWLSHEEMIARHAPGERSVEEVRAWLASRGLHVSRISSDRTLLSVETTAAAASAAFGISLRMYGEGAEAVRSHAQAPIVPARLLPVIQAIVGLTDVPLRADAVEIAEDGIVPYTPTDLRRAYDVDPVLLAGHDGTGRTVAITTWGSADPVALAEYSATHGLPAATLSHVDAEGGEDCGSVDLEWDLDVQMAHALAPGAALRVHCGAAATIPAMLAAIDRVLTDDIADVVSQSWGTCDLFVDSATAAAWETKFLQASAQGIAFFTASGDGGSRECSRFSPPDLTISPSWPATAPHTTSVGGTRLLMSGAAYANETTWNTCAPCAGGTYRASGGGPSLLYSKPTWQTAPMGETKRASADVSAVADPATGVSIRHAGVWVRVGGTSVSSPIVAGMWADAVSRYGRLGHAAPRFWSFAGDPLALRDLTTGTNGDFAAGIGYDHPTGLGSPRLAGLVDALARPGAPQALIARGGPGAGEITLTWTPPWGEVHEYNIYTGTQSGDLGLLGTTNATAFTLTGIAAGNTRYFQVAAQNDAGEGPRSLEASARAYDPPLPPRALAAATPIGSPLGTPLVRITWQPPHNANLAGVYGYRVFRDGEWFETVLGAAGTSMVDDVCPITHTCTYYATALGVVGESGPSNADTELGLSPGFATTGAPSTDPAAVARLIGHERLVLQMDADDHQAPMNGMTRDSSLFQDHARVNGALPAPGRFGNALWLHGEEDPLSLVLDPATSQLSEGTLMMWVDLAAPGVLFEKSLAGADPTLRLFVDDEARIGVVTTGPTLMTPPDAFTWTTWHHITAVWGPSGKKIYVDGELIVAQFDSSGVSVRSSQARIGPGLVGALDEVRLYDAALPGGLAWSIATRPYAS